MRDLNITLELRESIEATLKSMRKNMNDAAESLNTDAADEFFDSLFEASEDIIRLSNMIRDQNLDDKAFVTLVKAVSFLGANNAALIQEFTQMCSFIHRSPRPRRVDLD